MPGVDIDIDFLSFIERLFTIHSSPFLSELIHVPVSCHAELLMPLLSPLLL